MSLKEIKRQITELEKKYNIVYTKEQAQKIIIDEEARIERLKNKTIKLNERGKPVTGKKKICEYNCDHCHIICSSSESDEDFVDELIAYKSKK